MKPKDWKQEIIDKVMGESNWGFARKRIKEAINLAEEHLSKPLYPAGHKQEIPLPQKLKPKIIVSNSYTEDCTFCKKKNIELIDIGMPISGSNFVCPTCKRMNAEFYEDKLGVVTKTKKHYSISIEDHKEEISRLEAEIKRLRTPVTGQLSRNARMWYDRGAEAEKKTMLARIEEIEKEAIKELDDSLIEIDPFVLVKAIFIEVKREFKKPKEAKS